VSWKVLIGAALVLGVLLAGFILVGGVDISADRPDDWLSEHLLHFVFKRTEAARSASLNAPGDLNSEGRIRLAAQHFDMVCANCHGRPGYGQSVVALSMSPRPQYLPNVLGQFTDAELHQIVEHGVKYSAMPAWATDARSDEVWSMVAFLRRLPKLDARSYAEITAPPASSAATPIATGPDATLRAAYLIRKAQPVNEFLYAAPNWGFANETIHTNAVATCARCHGADGSGAVTGGEAPNLTIQDAAYLQTSLEAYTRGGRASGFMQTIAAELSRDQIAALATYYAGLPSPTSSPTTVDPALVRRGEALALRGVPETATPACANCHESTGAKLSGAPHIAGQSPIYLRRPLVEPDAGGRPQPGCEGYSRRGGVLFPSRSGQGVGLRPGATGAPAAQREDRSCRRKAHIRRTVPEVSRARRARRPEGRLPRPHPAIGALCRAESLRLPQRRAPGRPDAADHRRPEPRSTRESGRLCR
jgi:cytochrome c553